MKVKHLIEFLLTIDQNAIVCLHEPIVGHQEITKVKLTSAKRDTYTTYLIGWDGKKIVTHKLVKNIFKETDRQTKIKKIVSLSVF